MDVRSLLLFAIFSTTALIFAVLAIQALLRARSQLRPIRVLLYLVSALAGTYSIGSVLLVLRDLAAVGWAPQGLGSLVAGPLWLGYGITVMGVLLASTVRFIPIWRHLRHIDETVEAMAPGANYDIAASDLALTAREAEILGAIFDGALSDEEIAERLFVSRSTVSSHITNLMKKTGAKTRRELLLVVSKTGK